MDPIEFIENNLLPAINIDGQPEPRMKLSDRMAAYKVPGVSLAIIEKGQISCSKGFGLADIEDNRPVSPETLFQAASISKPVSALAAMALVQAGQLDLDADVNSLLKSWHIPENEFTRSEKVTLRRLFSHNAGLTVHGFGGYARNEEVPSIQQVLQGVPPANSEPVFVDVLPGSISRYSGGGTTVAQLLMMETTGLTHAELMQKYVLGPAGMSKSTYEQPLPAHRRGEAATGYDPSGNAIAGKWHTYPEQAAAGLWTTPEDLCRYIIELQKSWHGESNKILSKEFTRQMLQTQFGNYGFGPRISGSGNGLCFSHGGSNEGFRCEMMGFLHSGQGLAVMTNSDNGSGLGREIIRAAALAYGWQDYLSVTKKCSRLPASQLEQYKGIYAMQEFPDMRVEISIQNAELWAKMPVFLHPEQLFYSPAENNFFEAQSGCLFSFSQKNNQPEVKIKIGDFDYSGVRVD